MNGKPTPWHQRCVLGRRPRGTFAREGEAAVLLRDCSFIFSLSLKLLIYSVPLLF